MQTKSSYRVLKWTFLAGLCCSMATACVVSSGDGDDDDTDIGEGGESGSNNTSGSKAMGGSSGSGGNNGGSNSASGAPTDDGGEPPVAAGGTPSTFVPGECEVNEPITPTVEPSCDAVAGDDACTACVKLQACSAYQTCFGEEPATACSVGMTAGADGQFLCVSKCFTANAGGEVDADELLLSCASDCDECGTGGLNSETTDLIDATYVDGTCLAECFPFE